MKRKRATPIVPLGPRNQPKARSTSDPHQKNYLTFPDQAERTHPIPKRTHGTRNHMTVKKPIHCTFLLYQEEKWEAPTHIRLPTSQLVDYQKLISPTPNPSAN